MKKKQKDTPIVLKIIFVLIIVAQAFASTLFLSALAKLNLLQNWQFYIVVGVLVLFLLLNAYKLLVSRRAGTAAKIICALLAILISGAAILGFKYVQQMVSFVENITGLHYETTTYQVRTLKNGNYKDVSQLARQHVGFLSTNPNLDNTKNTLRNIVDYKDTDYEEIGSMLAALYDYEVAAVVINQSYLDFLEEAESTFEADTVVLQEFEVRTEAPDTHESAVDVTVEPFILYISGSDSRGSIKQVSRSDVNIVAVVNPKTAKILLISIPRDYYVQLHGTTGTKDKLTHAGVYGIEKSKTTIEDLLGIKINSHR